VLQPENVSTPESIEALRALGAGRGVVAAYGQILRQRFLDLPARGCVNVHASLLPRHRGGLADCGVDLGGRYRDGRDADGGRARAGRRGR
jgi:folate-dependent phosphoribosylglycinamide formyltransferase PurN